MKIAEQTAKHFRETYFGGNWTDVSLKDSLGDVTWQEATTKIYSLNTILALVYHLNYYVGAVLKVLQGEPLNASDKVSFNHPAIDSKEDWEKFLDTVWTEGGIFAEFIRQVPESKFGEIFSNEKYGIYYRNIHGIIEHAHYHLGQIVLIKKLIRQEAAAGNR